MIFKFFKTRRNFRRELAKQTPLIDGRETKRVARMIAYDINTAGLIIDGQVEFDPRDTYYARLIDALA